MQRAKSRGPRVLMVVILVGVLGYFAVHELGSAESLNIAPNDAYYPLLRAAEAEAAASDLGLWGACG
ncbi:hypothetical protein [Homoserinimonas sp. OAct 916]|uniref:hypothetical protein n=1 Tax=Homoserinimonas sp. OAct 916 TaxID=2211450 RepID=UPI0013009DE9|nr:hypothetical protein [Homoserinimonas sp. OAct 916]